MSFLERIVWVPHHQYPGEPINLLGHTIPRSRSTVTQQKTKRLLTVYPVSYEG